MGDALRLTRHEARIYAQRSGRNNTRLHQYMIEGETLTLAAIADRLGCTVSALNERMRRRRAQPGPLTWDSLRAQKPPQSPAT